MWHIYFACGAWTMGGRRSGVPRYKMYAPGSGVASPTWNRRAVSCTRRSGNHLAYRRTATLPKIDRTLANREQVPAATGGKEWRCSVKHSEWNECAW
jgi:hypothetical protein